MLYGLEMEFFIKNKDGNFILCPNFLPHDGCGWLVEARGKPHNNIRDAVFSLLSDVNRIEAKIKGKDIELVKIPIGKIPRKLKLEASRIFTKELLKERNLYGYEFHRTKMATAGIHLSITSPVEIRIEDGRYRTVNGLFDFVSIFRKLDKEFAEEIKLAKRRIGFYEIKPDRRIEYRSLPNDIDLFKLINVVKRIKT